MKHFWLFLFAVLSILPVLGQTWSQVGAGLDDAVFSLYADTISNDLYAGGRFTNSGTTQLNRIGYWDGTQWNAMGAGCNAKVMTVEKYNGEIYAGGFFTLADTTTVSYIAKWNGTTWQDVGGGMNQPVYCLYIFNGSLYAGGAFTTAGNQPCKFVARWDGSSWHPLDSNIVSSGGVPVQCISSFQNTLMIGGSFIAEDSANNIASLNGSAWQPLAGGTNSDVCSMREVNNELVITGVFTAVDAIGSLNIAKWNGTNWISIVGPMSNTVLCQLPYHGNIVFGGECDSFENMGWNFLSPSIANYNLSSQNWTGIDSGFYCYVYSLATIGNTLYAGGAFNIGGNDSIFNIAELDATALSVPEITPQTFVNIFPNPASEVVVFQFTDPNYPNEIIITDQLGREVKRQELTGENQIDISVHDLADGMYFYQVVENDNTMSCGKFVLLHR